MATDHLKTHRRRVAAAEASLVKARDLMRAAAELAGIETVGLFAEGLFIWRTTGERWAAEARREMRARCHDETINTIKVLKLLPHLGEQDGLLGPFEHLAVAHLPTSAPPMTKPMLVVNNVPAAETWAGPPTEGVNSDSGPKGAA
jgi:hypothetical protein